MSYCDILTEFFFLVNTDHCWNVIKIKVASNLSYIIMTFPYPFTMSFEEKKITIKLHLEESSP